MMPHDYRPSLDELVFHFEHETGLVCTGFTRTVTNTDFLYAYGIELPDYFDEYAVEGKTYRLRDNSATVWAVGFARAVRMPMETQGYGVTMEEALANCRANWDAGSFGKVRPTRKWNARTNSFEYGESVSVPE